jgi:hypothetical protein
MIRRLLALFGLALVSMLVGCTAMTPAEIGGAVEECRKYNLRPQLVQSGLDGRVMRVDCILKEGGA